jgi:ABC-type phosphate/phosphonate transport system substrate-binding protein
VPAALVNVAAKPFKAMMQAQTGLTGDIDIIPDIDTLAKRVDDKSVHLGVFLGHEFAWARQRFPELIPVVIAATPAEKNQALVIVHQNSPAKSLADLKGKSLAVPTGTKPQCLLFLERQQQVCPTGTCCACDQKPVNSDYALHDVFEKTLPAVLVDSSAWYSFQSLQPARAAKLRILAESDCFPPTVLACRKGLFDDAALARIQQGLVKANETPQGKPLMRLWKLRGFEAVPSDYDKQLEACLKAYPAPGAAAPVSDGGTAGTTLLVPATRDR